MIEIKRCLDIYNTRVLSSGHSFRTKSLAEYHEKKKATWIYCFLVNTVLCLLFVDVVTESYFEPQRPFFTRLPPRDKQKRPSVTSQSTEGPNRKPVRTTRGPKITTTAPELNTARVTEETTPRTEEDFSGKNGLRTVCQ